MDLNAILYEPYLRVTSTMAEIEITKQYMYSIVCGKM